LKKEGGGRKKKNRGETCFLHIAQKRRKTDKRTFP